MCMGLSFHVVFSTDRGKVFQRNSTIFHPGQFETMIDDSGKATKGKVGGSFTSILENDQYSDLSHDITTLDVADSNQNAKKFIALTPLVR